MPRTMLAVPQTYAALRAEVEIAMVQGQRAVEQAKVRTYHNTGRLIHEHLLLFQERADYGSKTVRRLAADLQVDRTVLHRCVGFYRAFPIVAHGQQLNWAHYRLLIAVGDTKLRLALAADATKQGWTSPELAARISARLLPTTKDGSTGPTAKLLTPRRGTPGICRVIADGDDFAVDLGFACYLRQAATAGFGLNDFVKVTKTGVTRQAAATKADLFTYRAEILKVVDGDTLWVRIFLRPDQWVKQKLRLRDLDCPEMSTSEGQAAKRFVDALVARTGSVTICTTKPDKYDRYLADVFLTTAGREVFLNNELLTHGHAARKGSYTREDWER